MTDSIPPPGHAAPWVDVLGQDLAIRVFLELGGATISLAYRPRASRLVELVGPEPAAALADRIGVGAVRVPLAKAWIAQVRAAAGVPVQEIARELHIDVATVRRQLKRTPGGRRSPPKDDRQMRLF